MPMDPEDLVMLRVDDELCIGVGQCEMLEPLVFRVDDDTGFATVLPGASLARDAAETVVARCPSQAISPADPS